LSFSAASIGTYVILDRCAAYLQVWAGISAWYPPVGLSFALFLCLGNGALVPMFAASFLAALVNYVVGSRWGWRARGLRAATAAAIL
jgi:hypothetical protein